ncbi:hypothetical protein BKA65DRAFT_557385 [Rhexocercosporidium sp. MPI-PUGE-AT-0058]|nr:hypothetical protein BKA65DRAFT_557385 [Rhexocercosporidium sp. MPI-PUGE-AT-0058]
MLLAFKSACNKAVSGHKATALSHAGSSEHLPPPMRPCFAANINDAETGAACVAIPLENMKWSSKSSPQSAARSLGNQSLGPMPYEETSEGYSTGIQVSTPRGSTSEYIPGTASTVESSISSLSADQVSTPNDGTTGPGVRNEETGGGEHHAKVDDGYHRLIEKNYESYPEGWPQLAAFQNSCDNHAMVRRFGTAHLRILLHLQAEVAEIEEQLDKLDESDATTGPHSELDLRYRLRCNEWKVGWDTGQKDLLDKLKKKLAEYDDWVLKDSTLRNLPAATKRDYLHVFHWLWGRKPLDKGQYEFMLRSDDFVLLAGKRKGGVVDRFIIDSCLSRWPKRLQFMQSSKRSQATGGNEVFVFSEARIAFAARLLSVCVAATVLMIPVFLLHPTNMSSKATSVMVLMFVLTFATIISLFTDAKMETVFVGTCAYCAVLVTLLGNVQVFAGVAGSI